jgi:hypothetical protein
MEAGVEDGGVEVVVGHGLRDEFRDDDLGERFVWLAPDVFELAEIWAELVAGLFVFEVVLLVREMVDEAGAQGF